jgi:anion-transporting  ArsA/GET3 family ATPase
MRDFFDSRLLQLLTTPAQSRVVSLMSKPFFQVADRVLGARFLSSIIEFFTLFRTMEKGFVERANKVESVLRNPDTKFAVVTTLEVAPAFEAEYLLNELQSRSFSLAALIANRVVPSLLASQTSTALAQDRSSVGAETLQAAAEECRPNYLCNYLHELAGLYSSFYEACPVLKAEEPARSTRLALCRLSAQVLRLGLETLGIEVTEKM